MNCATLRGDTAVTRPRARRSHHPPRPDTEIVRLRAVWKTVLTADSDETLLHEVLGPDRAAKLDLFDRAQLACVSRVCHTSATLSEAGRRLFAVSRGNRKVTNDADRLRKYLARFNLAWRTCSSAAVST